MSEATGLGAVSRTATVSPFLNPGTSAEKSSLAILHLRRDHLLPTFLKEQQSDYTGYREGSVTNTRFGSYPHSTVIGVPWGTQVLASRVDTGSRGRPNASSGQKRPLPESEGIATSQESQKRQKIQAGVDADDGIEEGKVKRKAKGQKKQAVQASTGFCHVLPPTPEAWTASLPHRTQVVYTPDYSYILQKLRVRPGSSVIEAGAGSGSFTHAAARAAFNGYGALDVDETPTASKLKCGRIFSFEYHEPRVKELQDEIEQHGLSSIVRITHRDVYESGFQVASTGSDGAQKSYSPLATHIFLDLPAPWRALPHLTRASDGPLDPAQTVHICIFLPCIEQVQRATTSLRAHGWVEINMQELSHKRIEVRREQVGLDLQGLRGVNATPYDLEEAVERLKEVEKSSRRSQLNICLLYTSPSPRDGLLSRMPSSA